MSTSTIVTTTTPVIQTAGTSLANQLKAGAHGTAAFVSMAVDYHTNDNNVIDTDALQVDLLAITEREFSKALCIKEDVKAAYAVFRGAFVPARINRHVTGSGILNISFQPPEGTPKGTSARFVTVTYQTPEELEKSATIERRAAAKVSATVRKEEAEHKEEAEIVRASMTAAQVLDRMKSLIPEISALTEADLLQEWVKQDKEARSKAGGKAGKPTPVTVKKTGTNI